MTFCKLITCKYPRRFTLVRIFVYRTCAIITRGLYIFYTISLFSRSFFQKILSLLVLVSIQERVMMAYIFYICFQEFNHAQKHWTEDFSIGAVYLKYADALLKAYPPYVNFYQDSKEMLKKCEKEPRFYAFLRVCQSKPESGRQHLADLMMHPIQVNLSNNIYFLKKCWNNAQKMFKNCEKFLTSDGQVWK